MAASRTAAADATQTIATHPGTTVGTVSYMSARAGARRSESGAAIGSVLFRSCAVRTSRGKTGVPAGQRSGNANRHYPRGSRAASGQCARSAPLGGRAATCQRAGGPLRLHARPLSGTEADSRLPYPIHGRHRGGGSRAGCSQTEARVRFRRGRGRLPGRRVRLPLVPQLACVGPVGLQVDAHFLGADRGAPSIVVSGMF
jgi:hypothetical protein